MVTGEFFSRFVDVSVDVRVECIKRAKEFLQHHPDLAADLTGELESCRELETHVTWWNNGYHAGLWIKAWTGLLCCVPGQNNLLSLYFFSAKEYK